MRETHFYNYDGVQVVVSTVCQSPSHRGTHFYLIYLLWCIVWDSWLCQSPSQRGSHFYTGLGRDRAHSRRCVNPLHNGELISTCFALTELPTGGVNPLHVGELISTASGGAQAIGL